MVGLPTRMLTPIVEPMKEKDAGKETTAARMLEMEGVVPVQEAHVNVGDADVETMEAASKGVAQGGTGRKRQGGSSPNIAQRLKRAGRFCKAAAA